MATQVIEIYRIEDLLKYSPDQERDDHGRFAGGGGVDMAPGFAAHLAIQKEEDRIAQAEERVKMAERIGAHPPTWLPKEKHEDWKATAERNKPQDYRRAALIFKAHEAKATRAAMHATALRATKIRETREMFAERWRNKL